MKLTIETLNGRERKRLSKTDPTIWRRCWFPRLQWHHQGPRTGPDPVYGHEFQLWVLIGWGGLRFEVHTGNR